eukprot:13325945-Alexandrium_andersonii.AAC.1
MGHVRVTPRQALRVGHIGLFVAFRDKGRQIRLSASHRHDPSASPAVFLDSMSAAGFCPR